MEDKKEMIGREEREMERERAMNRERGEGEGEVEGDILYSRITSQYL